MSETQSATTTQTLNTVTWWEIPVADLDKASSFYGAVFGWTFAPMGDGYLAIINEGTMIGGLMEAPDQVGGQGHRIYVLVADLETVLAATEGNGGSIRTPRTEIGGDMGWWAEIADPAGRALGLCSDNPAR